MFIYIFRYLLTVVWSYLFSNFTFCGHEYLFTRVGNFRHSANSKRSLNKYFREKNTLITALCQKYSLNKVTFKSGHVHVHRMGNYLYFWRVIKLNSSSFRYKTFIFILYQFVSFSFCQLLLLFVVVRWGNLFSARETALKWNMYFMRRFMTESS